MYRGCPDFLLLRGALIALVLYTGGASSTLLQVTVNFDDFQEKSLESTVQLFLESPVRLSSLRLHERPP